MKVMGPSWSCLSHILTDTELRISPALLYLTLTVTFRELLLIPSFADVETGSVWLNNLLIASVITV